MNIQDWCLLFDYMSEGTIGRTLVAAVHSMLISETDADTLAGMQGIDWRSWIGR